MTAQTNSPHDAYIYDGKLGALYKIFILNVFLGIITLGIYHFWGKTRIRRYLATSFQIHGDRFEYTGYGKEIFWGFVKALLFIIVVSMPLFYAFQLIETPLNKMSEHQHQLEQQQITERQITTHRSTKTEGAQSKIDLNVLLSTLTEKDQQDLAVSSTLILFYSIFFYAYLPYVAIYAALHYRVSRTQWRGIRGYLAGSPIIYGFIGFINLLLNVCTIGLWIPFSDLFKLKYKLRHLYFGQQRASFSPAYVQLFFSNILTGLACGLIFIMVVGGFGGFLSAFLPFGKAFANDPILPSITPAVITDQSAELTSILGFLIVVLAVLLSYAPRYWYKAALLRTQYNFLRFGNIGFQCLIGGWDLLKQLWINRLILVFTFGLGSPIVAQRRLRYFSCYVTVIGDVNNTPLLQSQAKIPKTGEGLSTAYHLEVSLF